MVDRGLHRGGGAHLRALAFVVATSLLALLPSIGAHASVKIRTPLSISLRSDIATRKSTAFNDLLERWQQRYGARAVEPLFEIAADRSGADPDRYVALMGAARLGGYATTSRVASFLGDPAWMIRSASLRLLGAFRDETQGPSVLPLLRDPALVVRLEAVATVEKLRAPGAADALVGVLSDRANYHGGKALWVPERALQALASLGAREVAPQLRPLLDHRGDTRLLERTVATLDALNGRPAHRGVQTAQGLQVRVDAWKAELARSDGYTAAATNGLDDRITEQAAEPVRSIPAKSSARTMAAPATAATAAAPANSAEPPAARWLGPAE